MRRVRERIAREHVHRRDAVRGQVALARNYGAQHFRRGRDGVFEKRRFGRRGWKVIFCIYWLCDLCLYFGYRIFWF